MATDLYHTLNELNIIFQELILEMLRHEKTGSPAAFADDVWSAVRIAYPTEGAPAWEIDENVVFIRVTEDDQPINRQREDVLSDDFVEDAVNVATTYTRVLQLNLVIYGPQSFDNAQTIRDGFFAEEYRIQLRGENIYPIPDIPAPNRAPEKFQGQWWERVDMEVLFNEKISKNRLIGYIESAEIGVYDNTGLVDTAEAEAT